MARAAFLQWAPQPLRRRQCGSSRVSTPLRRAPRPTFALRASAALPEPLAAAANQALLEHGLSLSSTTWAPPVLTVFIARAAEGGNATADDCATASDVVGTVLDRAEFGGDGYTLEVSTPGASDVLTAEHEFEAFKGFPVRVTTTEVFKKRNVFEGKLVGRTEDAVRVGVKGRVVGVPREIVAEVRLCGGEEE